MMNKMQERMITERLKALADVLGQIGFEFELPYIDSEGRDWMFKIHVENPEDFFKEASE